jgi:hypothetical protein
VGSFPHQEQKHQTTPSTSSRSAKPSSREPPTESEVAWLTFPRNAQPPKKEEWDMANLTIKLNQDSTTECCGLCGRRTGSAAGPRLFLADSADAVCRQCGNQHAPSLVALLDLARVAERVGRIGRHTLVPPLGALLDLARAAEDYTHSEPQRLRKVA